MEVFDNVFEKFDWVLRHEGRFVYVPEGTYRAYQDGKRDWVIFKGYSNPNPEWMNNPLRSLLKRIQDGEMELFTPHLTDPDAWKALADQLHLKWRRKRIPIPLADGSVAEVFSSYIEFGERTPSGVSFVSSIDSGFLVVLKRLHLSSHIRKTRRRIEDHLRKHPSEVIRVAKFLKLK